MPIAARSGSPRPRQEPGGQLRFTL